MRGLTVRQPWAWGIAWAGKNIENRSWLTHYRGPLAIHAASSFSRREYEAARDFMLRFGIDPPAPRSLQFGMVLAVTHLSAVRRTNDSDLRLPWESPGGYAFCLENTRRIEPFACRGLQRLWTVPENLERLLTRYL